MKKFGLIGAAGYIAPRHMKAIKETKNELVVALDKSDSVGVIDSYFPEASFFTETERFDRHVDKLRRNGKGLDYISVCSPNYLHDSHVRLGLRNGSDVICEKPLVINPKNAEFLKKLEQETGQKINNILQLRLHETIKGVKEKVKSSGNNKIYDFNLKYITARGRWYDYSWKGDTKKSGGLATNIGIHFFDMLLWIFGNVKENNVTYRDDKTISGFLKLEKANVNWFLSCDYDKLPQSIKDKNQRAYRIMTLDNQEIDFSDGFTDLHTISYQEILKGNGFSIDETIPSIALVHEITNKNI